MNSDLAALAPFSRVARVQETRAVSPAWSPRSAARPGRSGEARAASFASGLARFSDVIGCRRVHPVSRTGDRLGFARSALKAAAKPPIQGAHDLGAESDRLAPVPATQEPG